MTDTSITQRLAGFDAWVETMLREWQMPGCAVAVVKDGEVIHAKGYGLRDVEHNLPVTENTLFAIGSCTKAFTATCLGMLVDEGKLEWDTPVRDYMPDFHLFDPVATERMTPRDLLCHRSGLPRHDLLWFANTYTREELYKRLRHLEPSKDFRAAWQYQNLMYVTAGVLVERITGTSWEDFVRQRIFAPLGMQTSTLSVTDSQRASDYAHPYHEKEDQVKEIPFHNIDAIGPAGCINSSVSEMAHWLLLNLSGGKFGDKQLISEATLKEIHTPQMVMPSGNPEDNELGYPSYGLGWFINTYRGHLFVRHGGGIDGFASLTTLLPEQKAGIVILTNRDAGEMSALATFYCQDRLLDLEPVDWAKRMKERMEKAKLAEKEAKEKKAEQAPGAPATHPLADYVGTYEHLGYGTLSIKLDGDKLLTVYGKFQMPLRHLRYDTFEVELEDLGIKQPLQFRMDAEGKIDALSSALEMAGKPIEFRRVVDAQLRQRATLEKFTGQYELMGMTASVSLRGEGTLIITVPGQPSYELLPVDETHFKLKGLEGFSVEFKVGEDGRVIEAIFHQPNGDFTVKRK
jgi:CubicO group peptidase (beta-lactamase class C family)